MDPLRYLHKGRQSNWRSQAGPDPSNVLEVALSVVIYGRIKQSLMIKANSSKRRQNELNLLPIILQVLMCKWRRSFDPVHTTQVHAAFCAYLCYPCMLSWWLDATSMIIIREGGCSNERKHWSGADLGGMCKRCQDYINHKTSSKWSAIYLEMQR